MSYNLDLSIIIEYFQLEFKCEPNVMMVTPSFEKECREQCQNKDIKTIVNPYIPNNGSICLLRQCPLTDKFIHWKYYNINEYPRYENKI